MKQHTIGLIVPTTGRVAKYNELEASYLQHNAGKSVLIPAFSRTEFKAYGVRPNQFILDKNEGLTKTLNQVAKTINKKHEFVAFLADDFVIQTPEFDKKIIDYFDANPNINIVYCNDLFTSNVLATHWIVRSSITSKLGFLSLPVLHHMFTDNFWVKIGKDSNSIAYLDDIIIEHKHYINHKAELDDTYKLSNNQEVFRHDELAYNEYIESPRYQKHLKILKGL